MNHLQEEFSKLRKSGAPWLLVLTPDYRAAMRDFVNMPKDGEEDGPALWAWDILSGHKCVSKPSLTSKLGEPEETQMAPALFLKKCLAITENSVVFFIVSKQEIVDDPAVVQGIASLRDPFKSNKRTLVILSRSIKLPALLSEDVPVLEEPLPKNGEINTVINAVISEHKDKKGFEDDQVERVAALCCGLTRFAIEEAVASNMTKKGFDFKGLGEVQKRIIETTTDRALVQERSTESFDDVGGQNGIKDFMQGLFAGPRRPRLVVRIDEIEKSISAAATGTVADNTGISQDMLKVLLTSMQDNNWMGSILVGAPGTGKTLASVCTGNTFNVKTLIGDLGATINSLAGESGRRVRVMMEIIKAVGGENVLFMATANRLDTLPPELQRRFNLGIWFFDVPNAKERERIWKIQLKKFELDQGQALPDHDGWVGSDIRNCCQTAYMLNQRVRDAAKWLTLVGRTALKDIERLRDMAENLGFLSANDGGTFCRKPGKGKTTKFVEV